MSDATTFDDIPVAEPFEPRVSRSDRRRQRRVRSRIGRWWQQFLENRRIRREEALKAQDEPDEPMTDTDDEVDEEPTSTKKTEGKPEKDSPDTAFEERAQNRRHVIWAILLVLSALLIGLWLFNTVRSHQQYRTPSKSGTTPTVAAPADKRDPRFIQQDVGFGDAYRIAGKGLNGNTSNELSKSLLDNAGHNAATLAVYANAAGLWDDPNKVTPLLTKDKSYLSDEGIALWYRLDGAISANGTSKKVAQAPANGYNTGVSGGKYGRSDVAGIRGDRTALYITFKDGSVLIVMKRCGNPVFTGKPHLPSVPTDNPKPPRRPPLEPKHPGDDPYPRGNAPRGGGPNADPGPGVLTPRPADPPAKYVPPTPPPVTQPPTGSDPDPTPPPAPEPEAPTPDNPETGSGTPPGGGSI